MNYKTREYRFTDEHQRTYIFTVKESFFTDFPKLEAKTQFELNKQYKLSKYLHNLEGPASLLIDSKVCGYWIDGKKFQSKEEWEKEVHRIKFGNKLEDLVNE